MAKIVKWNKMDEILPKYRKTVVGVKTEYGTVAFGNRTKANAWIRHLKQLKGKR